MSYILIILGWVIFFWICRVLWRVFKVYRQMNGMYKQARRMYGNEDEREDGRRYGFRRSGSGNASYGGRKIPPEYAEDVEFEEVIVTEEKVSFAKSWENIKIENQVSDADWEEVK